MLPIKRLALAVGAAAQSMLELRAFQRLPEARRTTSAAPGRFVERLLRLGPLYVKIGQILSTRADVLPRQYISTLQQLQEHVPPMPFADVQAVVREDFHVKRISEVFSSFDPAPIASASVAQVHFATLITGEG